MLPSSDTNAATIKNPLDDLLTVTPCLCTASGKELVADCSLFCTCTWAVSGSMLLSKVKVTSAEPVDDELDDK